MEINVRIHDKYIIPYPSVNCLLSSFLSETLSSNSAEICSSPYCWSSNWRLRSSFTWFEPKVSYQRVVFLEVVPWKDAVAHTLLKESLKIIICKIKRFCSSNSLCLFFCQYNMLAAFSSFFLFFWGLLPGCDKGKKISKCSVLSSHGSKISAFPQ